MKLSATGKNQSIKIVTLIALMVGLTAIPASAHAGGAVHIDLPHFSLGFHNVHHGYRKRKLRRHFRKHYRQHRRAYHHRRHHDYYHDYYSGYRYYRPPTRYYEYYGDNYCPTPGYSSRYYRNRGCYSHGDHYHCED